MTTRRTNRALSATRRWTAGALLASTLAVGGLGLHLADAYATVQSGTVVAATTSTPSTPSSTTTSSSSGSTSALGSSSSTSGTTTTKGS